VADGEGELLHKASGEPYVTPARTMLGMVNLRRQITRYHYPPEEEGKPVGQMRPRKIDDDLVDDLRAFATHRWPAKPRLTYAEKLEREMGKNSYENLLKQSPHAEGLLPHQEMQLVFARERAQKRLAEMSGVKCWDEWGGLEE
jgi:hypothetical protein